MKMTQISFRHLKTFSRPLNRKIDWIDNDRIPKDIEVCSFISSVVKKGMLQNQNIMKTTLQIILLIVIFIT